ncbi:hypothetical protein ANMWB30_04430 [Arthrobacter sp. MWB30]|nr:hypothetical protein ANMWB30_04430 [Arthrobacter sp. MWB30]
MVFTSSNTVAGLTSIAMPPILSPGPVVGNGRRRVDGFWGDGGWTGFGATAGNMPGLPRGSGRLAVVMTGSGFCPARIGYPADL